MKLEGLIGLAGAIIMSIGLSCIYWPAGIVGLGLAILVDSWLPERRRR